MQISNIENIIGYSFHDSTRIVQAFTHSSYSHEHGGDNYERLEFLGDSILEAITTVYLYHNFQEDEGTLSKIRAKVVSAKSISEVVRRMRLDQYILVGGSINSKEIPENIIADVYESIVASIMLDGGLNIAKEFVLRSLLISKDNVLDICNKMIDYKTVLQERLQHDGKHATYDGEEVVVDGKSMYRVSLLIDGVVVDTVMDASKKAGQEAVAKKYLEENGGIF
jgi:ribonuclease-3